MAAGSASGFNSTADQEAICYTLTSTGDEIHNGWARHDDASIAAGSDGILYFGEDGQPIDPTQDGFDIVSCESSCCDEVIGDGCWEDGANSGRWASIRDADGNVTLIDIITGNAVDPDDVVDCPPVAFQTDIRQQTGVDNFTIPGGSVDLVGWSVAALTDGVQVSVGANTITLNAGEIIESQTPPDNNAILNDGPQIVTQAGESARAVWLRRA